MLFKLSVHYRWYMIVLFKTSVCVQLDVLTFLKEVHESILVKILRLWKYGCVSVCLILIQHTLLQLLKEAVSHNSSSELLLIQFTDSKAYGFCATQFNRYTMMRTYLLKLQFLTDIQWQSDQKFSFSMRVPNVGIQVGFMNISLKKCRNLFQHVWRMYQVQFHTLHPYYGL